LIKDLIKLKTVPCRFNNATRNTTTPIVHCNVINLNNVTKLGPNLIKLTKIGSYLSTKIKLGPI